MNNNLFFLCLAFAVLILSTVTICVAPLINNTHSHFNEWGTKNCQKEKDEYDYNENKNLYSTDWAKKLAKRKVDECFDHKAMHDLEYTSLIMDIVFGFICTILGFLHYYGIGKSIEKISGLIGLITGAIIAIITCIYVGYSSSIFNNGVVRDLDKLYSNRAYAQLKDGKYKRNYDEDKARDDTDISLAKFRDLGKKQYNYDSEYYKLSQNPNSEVSICHSDGDQYNSKKCEYLWNTVPSNYGSIENKYAYDRWLTSIILSVFIVACGLGLAVFGFFLFKNSGSSGSSGHVPVK